MGLFLLQQLLSTSCSASPRLSSLCFWRRTGSSRDISTSSEQHTNCLSGIPLWVCVSNLDFFRWQKEPNIRVYSHLQLFFVMFQLGSRQSILLHVSPFSKTRQSAAAAAHLLILCRFGSTGEYDWVDESSLVFQQQHIENWKYAKFFLDIVVEYHIMELCSTS